MVAASPESGRVQSVGCHRMPAWCHQTAPARSSRTCTDTTNVFQMCASPGGQRSMLHMQRGNGISLSRTCHSLPMKEIGMQGGREEKAHFGGQMSGSTCFAFTYFTASMPFRIKHPVMPAFVKQ